LSLALVSYIRAEILDIARLNNGPRFARHIGWENKDGPGSLRKRNTNLHKLSTNEANHPILPSLPNSGRPGTSGIDNVVIAVTSTIANEVQNSEGSPLINSLGKSGSKRQLIRSL